MIDELEWFARNMADWPGNTVAVFRNSNGNIMRVVDPRVMLPEGAIRQREWEMERDRLFNGRIDIIGQNGNDGEHYDQAIGIAGGLKWDRDKPRMDLLMTGMPMALEAVGEVLTFGAAKYQAHSWKLVENAPDRYYAAQIRHQLAASKGEQCDPETGLLHLAHEACNALFRLELALMDREGEYGGAARVGGYSSELN